VNSICWKSGVPLDQWDDIRPYDMHAIPYHSTPGHWADLSWLMLGRFGVQAPHLSQLPISEQMTQMSWLSLLSAPLFVSCDLAHLNPNGLFRSTTAMLTNDEVIDIDQDALGQAAVLIDVTDTYQLWAKPLADGAIAVGVFNFDNTSQAFKIDFSHLHLTGSHPVRDLWCHRDLGVFSGSLLADVPSHGVALLKIGTPVQP
jgi:alpha-galactosidase